MPVCKPRTSSVWLIQAWRSTTPLNTCVNSRKKNILDVCNNIFLFFKKYTGRSGTGTSLIVRATAWHAGWARPGPLDTPNHPSSLVRTMLSCHWSWPITLVLFITYSSSFLSAAMASRLTSYCRVPVIRKFWLEWNTIWLDCLIYLYTSKYPNVGTIHWNDNNASNILALSMLLPKESVNYLNLTCITYTSIATHVMIKSILYVGQQSQKCFYTWWMRRLGTWIQKNTWA